MNTLGTQEAPVISVLMTAYNREKYIAEAIESVLRSTFTDFELIIVDDTSKDGTVAIAKKYEEKDSRIKVFVNDTNLGDYNNRNRAASYASGKYLKYVDSDDLIYPHSLSVMVDAMEKFPGAALGIVSMYSQEEQPYPFQLDSREAYRQQFFVEKTLLDTGPGGLIFRTEQFRKIGGFSGKRYIGDIEINLRLAAKWPVVKIASSLIYWRRHEGQEYAIGTNSTGYLELVLPMYIEELNKPECPLSETQRQQVIEYYRKISARAVLNICLRKRQPGEASRIYRQLSLSVPDLFKAVFKMKKSLSNE
jgi:glycosyltransferase involved in cell wall biosynthesis